ncbi:MAG: hypothetical protein IKP88_15670 [Lachnospiraceae bacterium]|nr:hypothetical protein [Lachnospiraceae bacterium]
MCKNGIFTKTTTGILAILLLMITIFSSIYIITESDHECEGEDCRICHMIEICEDILHNTGKLLSFCITSAFMCSLIEFLTVLKSDIPFGKTLFDLKVRLNN